MPSHIPPAIAALVLLALATPIVGAAQDADTQAMIDNALSGAPPSVAAAATAALPTGEVLREGTNGFVCFPDDPNAPGNSPMCLDEQWLGWVEAWMGQKEAPAVSGLGVGYMLQGDFPASNTDPFATGPTADNEWMTEGVPHIMLIVSDLSELDGMSTDPNSGGPWVMWKGTPYAHVMVPTVPRR